MSARRSRCSRSTATRPASTTGRRGWARSLPNAAATTRRPVCWRSPGAPSATARPPTASCGTSAARSPISSLTTTTGTLRTFATSMGSSLRPNPTLPASKDCRWAPRPMSPWPSSGAMAAIHFPCASPPRSPTFTTGRSPPPKPSPPARRSVAGSTTRAHFAAPATSPGPRASTASCCTVTPTNRGWTVCPV